VVSGITQARSGVVPATPASSARVLCEQKIPLRLDAAARMPELEYPHGSHHAPRRRSTASNTSDSLSARGLLRRIRLTTCLQRGGSRKASDSRSLPVDPALVKCAYIRITIRYECKATPTALIKKSNLLSRLSQKLQIGQYLGTTGNPADLQTGAISCRSSYTRKTHRRLPQG
jgi:hypothetical protein